MSGAPIDHAALGFKCGLEIHQQLATGKLFCRCSTDDLPPDAGEPDFVIRRRLRPTQSELGEVDAAALQEARRDRAFEYHGVRGHACLVEADEEPPHEANGDAADVALTMALLLGASPVAEIQWMRKIVIDGSNTSGFQRSGLVSLGGRVDDVGVQTLALEEDSCQRLPEERGTVVWGLDRLGIPLIEVATEPTIRDGAHARAVAARLGALLRATGKVRRGIGTIRQDLNVSIRGGARIEIKGVQELNAIPGVIDGEVRRQARLLEVAKGLAARPVAASTLDDPIVDLGPTLSASASAILKKNRERGGVVRGVRLRGFHGLIGPAEQEGPRLGRELAAYARRDAGAAGILHGDELPGYGVTEAEAAAIRAKLRCGPEDSFALVADRADRVDAALRVVVGRARTALAGVPEEVRAAEPDESTTYLRPLPGAARMYPETDVPPVRVDAERLERLRTRLPPTPEKVRARLVESHGISEQQASQIVDAGWEAEFAALAAASDGPLAARILVLVLPDLRRRYPAASGVEAAALAAAQAVKGGRIAKEGAALVLEEVAAGRASNVEDAIARVAGGADVEADLAARARALVQERADFVRSRGKASAGPLMGELMKEFRGKVDGGVVSRTLDAELERFLSA